VSTLAQQEVVTEAEPRREPGQALGVDDRRPQPRQLALVGCLVGVVEVLGGDQLEDRVAEILQPFVVGRPTLRMLVVVGAMGQRLPQQGDVVKPNAKRPLEFL
jgi:hypothetical protein